MAKKQKPNRNGKRLRDGFRFASEGVTDDLFRHLYETVPPGVRREEMLRLMIRGFLSEYGLEVGDDLSIPRPLALKYRMNDARLRYCTVQQAQQTNDNDYLRQTSTQRRAKTVKDTSEYVDSNARKSNKVTNRTVLTGDTAIEPDFEPINSRISPVDSGDDLHSTDVEGNSASDSNSALGFVLGTFAAFKG